MYAIIRVSRYAMRGTEISSLIGQVFTNDAIVRWVDGSLLPFGMLWLGGWTCADSLHLIRLPMTRNGHKERSRYDLCMFSSLQKFVSVPIAASYSAPTFKLIEYHAH
jgi:hypothetical protein